MQQTQRIWYPLAFLLCHLFALLIYGSWLFEPTRVLWDALDTQLFYFLNGFLEQAESWQVFWATANTRIADVTTGLGMIAFFFLFIFSGAKAQRVGRLSMFGIMSSMILLSQDGGLVDLYKEIISVSRASPSLTLEPVYRLSELVPHIKAKDASHGSFPGDHGIVTFIWVGCIWFFANWRWGVAATLIGTLILLPRMVAGAHWLSDNLVGSSLLVLLMVAWILCTPLAYYLQRLGEWILGFILPQSWRSNPRF
ncbi:phosphatase PAP2 family protein [Sedimenticola selenatireducens]|uniref:Phosphatase PAP2 family protein n=1 Tax=Sedimenticola selenatireducens TaxID=191960 RepID=A0A558DRY5_9GAMM|nr:phosphatase PAP2 family protein [Sedimenticola selenatireducens]TVO75809.1 phosphatase PAP2 family protein [Sedimenticola selenatireducens]TVT63668.1 MAG: phosphatase PAP2 family protein [Sedimenticola selenatireducens]